MKFDVTSAEHLQCAIDMAEESTACSGYHAGEGDDDLSTADLEAMRAEGSGSLWYAWSGPKDDSLAVAITGNGPTSRANAKFFSCAREMVLALAAEVQRLRAGSPMPGADGAQLGDWIVYLDRGNGATDEPGWQARGPLRRTRGEAERDVRKSADSSGYDPLAPMTAEKRAQCEAADREHPAKLFVSDELAALRVLAEAVGTLIQANDEASVWGKTRSDIAWRSVRAAFKAAEPFTRKEQP